MMQAILLEALRAKPAHQFGGETQSAQAIVATLSDISQKYPVNDYKMRSER